MDGAADAGAAALGAWASIRGYFTPATLFLVVNLVIGTIVLTSRSHQRRRRQDYHLHDDAGHHDQLQPPPQEYSQYYHPDEQQQYVPPPPAPLARTSSVLDRIRSIGLYRFRSGDFPPEYGSDAAQDVAAPVDAVSQAHYARSRSEPAPVPAPPAREERKAAVAASRLNKSSTEARKAEVVRAPATARVVVAAPAALAEEEVEEWRAEEYVPPLRAPAPPLVRTSSVLDRLRSFSLYSFRSGDLGPEQDAAAAEDKKQAAAAHYDRSRSEPASKKGKKKQAAMSKSSSEARTAAPGSAAADEGGVDARADDFINKFRQQLQLQRLNSLLNYKTSN